MAKRRSKKERIRAEKHREAKIPSVDVVEIRNVDKKVENKSIKTTNTDYLKEIFSYDPKLIMGDLKKTLLVVVFILLVLLTITLLYT